MTLRPHDDGDNGLVLVKSDGIGLVARCATPLLEKNDETARAKVVYNAVRNAATDGEPFLLAIRPERIGILEKVRPDERTATASTIRRAATDRRATRATNATARRSR